MKFVPLSQRCPDNPYVVRRWLSEDENWELYWELTLFRGIRVKVYRRGSSLVSINLCAGKEVADALRLTDYVMRYLDGFPPTASSWEIERGVPPFRVKPVQHDPMFYPLFDQVLANRS